MSGRNLAHDLLLCAATASLLFVGPLLDLFLHPDSPLWLPWATMPDAAVYVALFRRAAEGALCGDPFVWEHRVDPSSIFSVYAVWPRIFGSLMRDAGNSSLPLASFCLTTFWLFGLYRLAKALGQAPWRAFVTAGVACFFSVNLAYNLNGYHFRLSAWNFTLTEHLRVYPSAASMAVYALAAWRLYAAVSSPTVWRTILAGVLMAATALGRPFDWMVLETAGALLTAAHILTGQRRKAFGAICVTLLGGILASPIILKLTLHQARHAEPLNDMMWRGIYHAKSWAHYGKYTLALAAVVFLLFLASRWVLGGKRLRAWPLAAVFPCVMVVASLLPYYHTLPTRVTVTGYAYFFVFSFSTWITLALFQFWHLAEGRPATGAPTRGRWLPYLLLAAILAQQLALGIFQRNRQAANVVPAELRQVYRRIAESAPPSAVILTRRNGTEVVAETGRWLFSPSPLVATMVSSTPTSELLERALWAEALLGGNLASLAPLFREEGLADYEGWKARLPATDRAVVDRLEKKVGYNTFVFHPLLNHWDLRARKLTLPATLAGRDDFVAWFRPGLREIFPRVSEAVARGFPPPFKLDMAIITPGDGACSDRLRALGFQPSRFAGGIELWTAKSFVNERIEIRRADGSSVPGRRPQR